MKNLCVAALAILITFPVGAQEVGPACSTYTFTPPPALAGSSAANQHINGQHTFSGAGAKQCTYVSALGPYCGATATIAMYAGASDSGVLITGIGYHVSHTSVTQGDNYVEGAASTTGTGAAAWESCVSPGCFFTVSSSPISFPAASIFTAQQNSALTCPAEPAPVECITCPTSGVKMCGNPPHCPVCVTCQDGVVHCGNPIPQCPPSPITVDTTGNGFDFTSADRGVMFDIRGDKKPIKVAWTEPSSGNALLGCLGCWKDVPDNGKIDSGLKLFGSATEQPPCPDAGKLCEDGYRALAVFDTPENGGNNDGRIGPEDAVWEKLVLFRDDKHNGDSTGQLHSLEELGVHSIGLKAKYDKKVDRHGNEFLYWGVLNPDPADGTSRDGRRTYDVFLMTTQDKWIFDPTK